MAVRFARSPARQAPGTLIALPALPPASEEIKDMTIKIVPNEKGNPVGKLADAELHFDHGPLEGLKLIGFGVWERKSGTGRNVTFPARQYSVNGERRSFSLLRPINETTSQERVRDLVLEAYAAHEAAAAVTT
ncbi:MAG: hypothetical protein ABJC89_18415 [Acidobacteriota bacterium]